MNLRKKTKNAVSFVLYNFVYNSLGKRKVILCDEQIKETECPLRRLYISQPLIKSSANYFDFLPTELQLKILTDPILAKDNDTLTLVCHNWYYAIHNLRMRRNKIDLNFSVARLCEGNHVIDRS